VGKGGGRNPGYHSHKHKSCSFSERVNAVSLPGVEPGAPGQQAQDHRPAPSARVQPDPPSEGLAQDVSGRRRRPRRGQGRGVGSQPRGPPSPAPRQRPREQPIPWTCRVGPAPVRAFSVGSSHTAPPGPRARSPRIRWLPHCTAPAPVLRGRCDCGSCSSSGSGSSRRPAAGPPARPRPRTALPRRRTRPAPAPTVANQRTEGAEQAARQARPIQLSKRAKERTWKWASDSSAC
jgi:hypothetical protein